MLASLLKDLRLILRDVRAGRLVSAAARLARRSNLESIGATAETRRWIRTL